MHALGPSSNRRRFAVMSLVRNRSQSSKLTRKISRAVSRAASWCALASVLVAGLRCAAPEHPIVATQLALTTPAVGAASGAAFNTQPVVTLRDAQGSVVTTTTAVVTMTVSAGGTLVGAATATTVRGIATFVNAGIRGTAALAYTLSFSSENLAAATQTISLTAGALATVRVSLADSVLLMGRTTAATAQGLDSTGNAVGTIPVTYASTDTSIALVSTSGAITALYEGTVTIRATSGGTTGETTLRVLLDPTVAAAYWRRTPNAVPDLSPYFSAVGDVGIIPLGADVNRDGKNDFIMYLWHPRTKTEQLLLPPTGPVRSRMVVLLANADGTFRDGTLATMGTPDVDLGGAVGRNVRAYDLNGDGSVDWIYALNKEDGRTCIQGIAGCANWGAQSGAILSQGNGKYRAVLFGDSVYHHSLAVVPGAGDADILFGPAEQLSFANGAFRPASGYPFIGGGFFVPLAIGSTTAATHLVHEGHPNGAIANGSIYPIALSTRRGSGPWTTVDSLLPSETFTMVDWIGWNGDGCTKCAPVFTVGGQDYVSSHYWDGCSLRLSPQAPPIAVVKWESGLLIGGLQGRTRLTEGVGMTGVQQLLLFDVSHDKLERLSVIDGAMTAPGDVHCRDVNGDGYDDLVADGIGDGVRPIVFLNNHAGRLVRVPDSVFPPNPSDGSGGWQSYFLDIDGDGIEDLLYFPRASCDGRAACANFPVYKGRRPLRVP